MRPATKKRLKELGYRGISGYTRSPIWIARRSLYFKTHAKRCWICGKRTTIHLHHVDYTRVGGWELDSDLLPLCKAHHRGLHSFMKRHRIKLEVAHPKYKAALAKKKLQTRRKRV